MNASKEQALGAFDYLCAIEQVIDQIVQTPSKADREKLEGEIKPKIASVMELLEMCQRKLPSEAAYEREKQRRASKKKLNAPLMPEVG